LAPATFLTALESERMLWAVGEPVRVKKLAESPARERWRPVEPAPGNAGEGKFPPPLSLPVQPL